MPTEHDLDPDAMTEQERLAKRRYQAGFAFETMPEPPGVDGRCISVVRVSGMTDILAVIIRVKPEQQEIVIDAVNEVLNTLVRAAVIDDPNDDAWKWCA